MRKIVREHASAFAPGTIGNIGPGLDILGLAVRGDGDTVHARVVDRPGVHIVEAGHPELPGEASRHTSGIAAKEVLRRAGVTNVGVELSVTKVLPLSGGQGGSAASAVAGAMAVNALLDMPLRTREILGACLAAESTVAGRHLDNIAPSVLGGCVVVRSVDELDVVKLDIPAAMCDALRIVLVHPHQRMPTVEGRSALPDQVTRATFVTQAAQIAAMVTAFTCGDLELLGRSVRDVIAEPARAPLLRGFEAAKRAALGAGALGCSISGSGPTAFAFASTQISASAVADAMRRAYAEAGVKSDVRITGIDTRGAQVDV